MKRNTLIPLLLVCTLSLAGCSKSNDTSLYTAGESCVLIPEASDKNAAEYEFIDLDTSNVNSGYFMCRLDAGSPKTSIRVAGPDRSVYNYFLEETKTWTVIPLTAGNGTYEITARKQTAGDLYMLVFDDTFSVRLQNKYLPYLYPNQYVNFTPDDDAVLLAKELTADAKTDLEAFQAIYEYVHETLTYDFEKAETTTEWYYPDIDETLNTKTGMCYDYAVLTAAMLRSVGIPTRLNIGNMRADRHAWVDVHIETSGTIGNYTFGNDEWIALDPTNLALTDEICNIDHTYITDYWY